MGTEANLDGYSCDYNFAQTKLKNTSTIEIMKANAARTSLQLSFRIVFFTSSTRVK